MKIIDLLNKIANGEIDRNNYEIPEEETISQLKKINKPFVVILNTRFPDKEETQELCKY